MKSSLCNVGFVVPVLNAAEGWSLFAAQLQRNLHYLGLTADRVMVIDSESSDSTAELVLSAGFQYHKLARQQFDHGATRQLGVALLPNAEFIVYLTQDAVVSTDRAVEALLSVFSDSTVGAAYGRQEPRLGAGPIERHARIFNYPSQSCVRSLETKAQMGLKSVFLSNSFAAYRRSALLSVGGFRSNTILGEDMMVSARLHLAGWKTAYVAEASVRHSHCYPASEEFRRYFDTGVLHASEPWLLECFGTASGEGMRFIMSELRYLCSEGPGYIPIALMRDMLKCIGYRLGMHERALHVRIKSRLSMNRGFWRRSTLPGIGK